jgi:hypothetical protein
MLLVLMAPWWWQAWWWKQVPALWRDRDNRLAWIWLLGTLLVFSLVSGKQPYYLLPDFTASALLLGVAAQARPRLGFAPALLVLVLGAVLLAVRVYAIHVEQPFPPALLVTLPVVGAVLLLLGAAMLRWRSLPVQASGVLLAAALLHAAFTPLLRAQFDFTPTARVLGEAQQRGTRIAFLGEYQLQFHFAGRLREPLELLDEAGARNWAERNPDEWIVVNTREDWRMPGPQPVTQQRFRNRWIQVWRAGDWRALPAQQLPLQATAGELRRDPR